MYHSQTADGEFAGRRDTIHLAGAERSDMLDMYAKGMVKVGDTVTLTVDEENRSTVGKKPQCNTSAAGSTSYRCLEHMLSRQVLM